MQFGRGKPAVGAFFDSDFATMDSVLALAVLHGLQGKNDCRVANVTISRPNLAAAGFVDMVERYYRGPAAVFAQVPPVGMRTAGQPGVTSPAFTKPFEATKLDGTPLFKNEVRRVNDTGDPCTLIRNYLEAHADQNAFFALAGPATNLAAALDFRGMKDLIAAKLKYLVVADRFTSDVAAAKKVFRFTWWAPRWARRFRFRARASTRSLRRRIRRVLLFRLIRLMGRCLTTLPLRLWLPRFMRGVRRRVI